MCSHCMHMKASHSRHAAVGNEESPDNCSVLSLISQADVQATWSQEFLEPESRSLRWQMWRILLPSQDDTRPQLAIDA